MLPAGSVEGTIRFKLLSLSPWPKLCVRGEIEEPCCGSGALLSILTLGGREMVKPSEP